MNQQINLYQPIFRRQKKVFSAVAMMQICLFFLVIFSLIYLYGHMKMQPFKDQLEQLNQDIALLNGQLIKLERQQFDGSAGTLMENEISRLTRELDQRKQVQDLLSSQSFGNTDGLSGFLEAFARQHVQGIWLTKISVQNGGNNLGLEGKTLQSELVPVYIERLAREALLSGKSFNVMELTRPVEISGQLDFYVSTN